MDLENTASGTDFEGHVPQQEIQPAVQKQTKNQSQNGYVPDPRIVALWQTIRRPNSPEEKKWRARIRLAGWGLTAVAGAALSTAPYICQEFYTSMSFLVGLPTIFYGSSAISLLPAAGGQIAATVSLNRRERESMPAAAELFTDFRQIREFERWELKQNRQEELNRQQTAQIEMGDAPNMPNKDRRNFPSARLQPISETPLAVTSDALFPTLTPSG